MRFLCYNLDIKNQEKEELLEMKKIIKEKPYLVWYTKNIDNLSESSIVESVLNWGDFEDVQKMIEIFGIQKIASIFREQASNKRSNYRPEIKNYFQLYFNKYA